MKQRTAALKTAIVVGLLCLFALGRVAYAAHQCYRLAGGGCSDRIERVVEAKHADAQPHTEVCAQAMEEPDDTGNSASLTYSAFVGAAAPALAFVPAPQFQPPRSIALDPPPARVTVLARFGRLRL